MPIVRSGLEVLIKEFLFDISPDLSILQVGVQLNDLDHLLFFRSQLVKVEAASVEGAEDHSSAVVGF